MQSANALDAWQREPLSSARSRSTAGPVHALAECFAPRGAPPRLRRHPAVAGVVDQRRRERRLIQKAPADSATRTPIHPAKRSLEDRCIVSGSSIDDEGIPGGTWSQPRHEPQRTQERPRRLPATNPRLDPIMLRSIRGTHDRRPMLDRHRFEDDAITRCLGSQRAQGQGRSRVRRPDAPPRWVLTP
jgi:hypothetical protein